MTVHRQLILLLIVAAIAPATASAASGGATPGEITLPGDPPTVVRIGNPLLSARTADISISTRASSHVRGRVRIDGTVPAGTTAGVRIERRDAQRGWVVVATAAVADDGAFHAVWRPRRAGGFTLRAILEAASAQEPDDSDGDDAAPRLDVAIYQRGVASWYGPGLWGVETACGVTLEPTTLGVAHRTLPCGTQVALYRFGRTLVVPVIDRGPYLSGRTWDLTLATFRGLGGDAEDGLMTLGAIAAPTSQP